MFLSRHVPFLVQIERPWASSGGDEVEKVIAYYYGADLATAEGRLGQLVGQARQYEDNAHISDLGEVLPRVRVRGGELLGTTRAPSLRSSGGCI